MNWIAPKCARNHNELKHVDPAFASLIFRHERLRTVDSPRNLVLRKPRILASGGQHFPEDEMFFAVDRSAHVAREGNEQGKLIPKSDYPK
jgi:hypothetical protein